QEHRPDASGSTPFVGPRGALPDAFPEIASCDRAMIVACSAPLAFLTRCGNACDDIIVMPSQLPKTDARPR
ncbi:MAG TPA: hypothetical protein PKW66_25015, partial [Polyangiaceae bacterium]|nr:hypothetical protein [Polyangiaceae bacterium]